MLVVGALWIGTLDEHFQADLSGLWGAGRIERQGRDPYADLLYVDGVYFARTRFVYGPLVSTLLRPLGALDYDTARRLWLGVQVGALVGLLAAGVTLGAEGPDRIARYYRIILPVVDRTGELPPQLFSWPTPDFPNHRWDGGELRNMQFVAGGASATRVVRRRWGYAAGTAFGAAGLIITLLVSAGALRRAPHDPGRRSLAWLAAVTAMLVFQPMTWVMGCVHLVVVGLRGSGIRQFGGTAAAVVAVLGLALVGMGDVLVPFLPRRVAFYRPILGLAVLWTSLSVLLAKVGMKASHGVDGSGSRGLSHVESSRCQRNVRTSPGTQTTRIPRGSAAPGA